MKALALYLTGKPISLNARPCSGRTHHLSLGTHALAVEALTLYLTERTPLRWKNSPSISPNARPCGESTRPLSHGTHALAVEELTIYLTEELGSVVQLYGALHVQAICVFT